MKFAASYLSIKEDLKDKIKVLENASIDYIHVDVMDGKFVANKTIDIDILKTYLIGTKPLDVHLMVENIIPFIDDYSKLNPEFITFHIEATDNPKEIIEYIKSKNIKVGVALNPKTPNSRIFDYLNMVDLVLIMSVEAGRGGQEFISSSEQKLDELVKIRNEKGYNYLIELDGGINDKTIKKIIGADIAVVGSYITNSDNYDKKIKILKDIVESNKI